MKNKSGKLDYSAGFTYGAILCSMLLVFPFKIGGMDALPAILFFLCIVWMMIDIWQINRGKRKSRTQYRRLDLAAILLLVYEVVLIAVSMMQEIGENEPEPDYSWNVLVISLVLLYFLVMEAGTFRLGYLDMILYSGLAVMAVLLLGYLFEPTIGERVQFWEVPAAAASYLIMVGIVGALQYCRCEERGKRVFYGMCAGLAFFLLACNHSVISFWIMVYALLAIPVLIRPTAFLCKNAMQMLFLFLVIISSMGLLTNETGLFLVPVHYDVEHSVYLDLVAAVGGLIFFYCWYRKPEGVSLKKIVMRGFYRVDKSILRGMILILALFVSGGSAWKTLDSDRLGFRAVSGFAAPLLEEAEQNDSLLYLCMREHGVVAAILCILVLVLIMERSIRTFGWDKPVKGASCVIAVSLLPQILLWEMAQNILPAAVILLGDVLRGGEKPKKAEPEETGPEETEPEETGPEETEPEETGPEEIDIEEIVLEEIKIEKSGKEEVKKHPEKRRGNAGKKKSRVKFGRGRGRR